MRPRLRRVKGTGGVDPVGEQDQHPLAVWLLLQALGCQRNRVADRGGAAGQADHAVAELLLHAGAIEGQRGQGEGALAEHHQPDPVAGAAFEEICQHRLGRGQAVDDAPAEFHVLLAHARRQVDRQHQVAPDLRRGDRRAELLRARGGHAQQAPREERQPRKAAWRRRK